MTRVEENREAQRMAEQKLLQDQDTKKTRESGDQFQKLVTSKQATTQHAVKRVTTTQRDGQQRQNTGQRSEAQNALLARQGIHAQRFQGELQHKGTETLQTNKNEAKQRTDDMKEKRVVEERSDGAERKLEQSRDPLAAISRDERGKGQGDGGEMGHGGGDNSGGQMGSSQGGAMQAEAMGQAAPTQGAQGTNAPRLSPEVIQALVQRCLVFKDLKGRQEMEITLRENVLGGATVKITAENGDISLRFATQDTNVRRLLKSGESQGELARAFESKGLRLKQIEVA